MEIMGGGGYRMCDSPDPNGARVHEKTTYYSMNYTILHAESTPFHLNSAHRDGFRRPHISLETGRSFSTSAHLNEIHLFPPNLGGSARILDKVHPISAVRHISQLN